MTPWSQRRFDAITRLLVALSSARLQVFDYIAVNLSVVSGNIPWADLSDEDLSFGTALRCKPCVHLLCVFFGFDLLLPRMARRTKRRGSTHVAATHREDSNFCRPCKVYVAFNLSILSGNVPWADLCDEEWFRLIDSNMTHVWLL